MLEPLPYDEPEEVEEEIMNDEIEEKENNHVLTEEEDTISDVKDSNKDDKTSETKQQTSAAHKPKPIKDITDDDAASQMTLF